MTPVRPPQPSLKAGPVDQLTTPITASAPVYRDIGGALAVIGVVSWSTGPALSEGCGGLTGVTPLARYRAWLVEQAGKMGSPLAP